MLRNGRRKESLKRRSEVEGEDSALVCPKRYFLFLIEPLQVLQAALRVSRPALTGRPGHAGPRLHFGRQDCAHGSACPQLPQLCLCLLVSPPHHHQHPQPASLGSPQWTSLSGDSGGKIGGITRHQRPESACEHRH